MATPLTTLSKYTGATMAVLCGLLMISFVVADPLMQYFNMGATGQRKEAGRVVASWGGGSINERQLANAVQHQAILSQFQQAVYTLGVMNARDAGVEDTPLRVRPLQLPVTPEQGVERDVVQKKILAEQARAAGMVVSDEMIVDFLQAIGHDRVTTDEMRSILAGPQLRGTRATIDFVFELIRESLLARNYLASHQFAFQTMLPTERWEDWLMVNDRVVIEAVALPASEYLAQVDEPSDADLSVLFNEFREVPPSPQVLPSYNVTLPSPDPGFATPEMVTVQYIKADFEAATERFKAEVTEEEIDKFYNDNLDKFERADATLFGTDSLFDDEEEATEEAPAEDNPAEDNAAEADTTEEAAEPATEQEAESSEQEAAEEATTEEESSNPLRDESAATEEVEEEEEEEEVADSESADDEQAAPKSQPVYQTLDEVREEIREQLAQIKAAEAVRKQMILLKSAMDDEYDEYFGLLADAMDAKQPAPAPPASLTDLAPLAEKEGLEAGRLGPISLIEMQKDDVGRTIQFDSNGQVRIPLWYLTFSDEEGVDLYEPFFTIDSRGNLFVGLLTQKTKLVIPELDDVRDQVTAAWKANKAAEAALAEGQLLAKTAQDSGQMLAQFFADNQERKVLETDPFAFLTVGRVTQQGDVRFDLSQPEPLVAAGPELMNAVFDLKQGEVTAVLNHDRSIAYLVRIATHLESEEKLHERFLAEGDNWFGLSTMLRSRIRRSANDLYRNLLDGSGLVWEREPDEFANAGQ